MGGGGGNGLSRVESCMVLASPRPDFLSAMHCHVPPPPSRGKGTEGEGVKGKKGSLRECEWGWGKGSGWRKEVGV